MGTTRRWEEGCNEVLKKALRRRLRVYWGYRDLAKMAPKISRNWESFGYWCDMTPTDMTFAISAADSPNVKLNMAKV